MTEERIGEYKEKLTNFLNQEIKIKIGVDITTGKNIFSTFKPLAFGKLVKTKIADEQFSCEQYVILKETTSESKIEKNILTVVNYFEDTNPNKCLTL
jgi:hypothetical protein